MRFNKSLVLMVIAFVVLGIVIIDGSSILFGKWQLSSAVDAAAIDASISYSKSKDVEQAKEVAQAVVDERLGGATVVKVTASEEGAVTVVVTKQASTFFVQRVDALAKWGRLRAESTSDRQTA